MSVYSSPRWFPEIFSDPPALDIGNQEKNDDRKSHEARQQPERQQWTADELGEGNGRRPQLAGPVAVAFELRRELGQVMGMHASAREHAERVAQPVRHECEADGNAQKRLGPGASV